MWRLHAGWVVLSLVGAACGGDVVVDDPPEASGSRGSGASGSGPSGTSGPGSGTGASPSSSSATGAAPSVGGGSPGTACGPACDAIAGCTAVDCLSGCVSSNPSCAFAFEPFLDCVAFQTNPTTCDLPIDCTPLLGAWLDCESWCTDGRFGCFAGDDGSCGCITSGNCGPVSSYETFCEPGPDGSNVCQCIADGQFVGKCIDDPASACYPFTGCCALLYFVPASSF